MPTFAPAKPVGIFNPRDQMVVLAPFMQMRPGQPSPRGSYSKLRLWWRRGYIAARKDVDPAFLKQIEADYAEACTPKAKVEEEVIGPATALSAVEGERGWWTVSFDDGTEQKMRKAQVAELGLIQIEEVPDGETV